MFDPFDDDPFLIRETTLGDWILIAAATVALAAIICVAGYGLAMLIAGAC